MIFTGKNRKPIVIVAPSVPLVSPPSVHRPRGNLKYNMFDAVKPTNCGYCNGNK